jgi:fructose-bisphosphate aldolase class 1
MKAGAVHSGDGSVVNRRIDTVTAKLLKRTWALARAFGRTPAERVLLAAGIDEKNVAVYLGTKTDRRKRLCNDRSS